MNQSRCVLISASEPSIWGSCKIITPNIEAAYRRTLGRRFRRIRYDKNQTPSQIFELARKIKAENLDKLIFADHAPHPYALLVALGHVGISRWPEIVFHVYGDFTLFISDWLKSEKILVGKKVTWVVASTRQKQLLQTMLSWVPNSSIIVCPFPVDQDRFSFDASRRFTTRAELGHCDTDKLIFYTGRLSLQKNVIRMVWEFHKYILESKSKNVYLYLAGAFDDIGAPFFGIGSGTISFQRHLRRAIEKAPGVVRERIRFLGEKDNLILSNYYCAADLFFSLSTHHDEDYGMSPIEALCCGTPALLSSWGGFGEFCFDQRVCDLIPVTFSQQGLAMSSGLIQAKLNQKLANETSLRERELISEFYCQRFSITAVQAVIKTIVNAQGPHFSGFSTIAGQLKTRMEHYGNPFGNRFDKKSLYFKIYKNYVEDYGSGKTKTVF